MYANLTIDVAGGPGVNPDEQHAQRQLEAGERVLMGLGRRKTISMMPIPVWALN